MKCTLALLGLWSSTVLAEPLGTAFNYQGKLTDGGNPATGSYDLKFTLYDVASGGTAVAGPITNPAVGIANGLLNVVLDFGTAVFTGNARWLEITVRTNGNAGDFTTMHPRQMLTPAPYALYALTPAGPQGVPGPQGQNGETGAQGPKGDTGVTGPQGLQGPKGDTGLTGVTGPQGPVGPIGLTGATGAAGAQGAQGPAGPPGLNWRGNWSASTSYVASDAVAYGGSSWLAISAQSGNAPAVGSSYWSLLAQQGDQGLAGAPGATGATGATGQQGAPGPQGLKGDTGATGATGPQGPPGTITADSVTSGQLASDLASLGKMTGGGLTVDADQNLALNSALVVDNLDNNNGSLHPGITFGRNSGEGIASKRTTGGDPDGLDFYTWSQNRMCIRLDGNVGIGTTTPSSLLQVAGTVTANAFSGSGAGLTGLPAGQLTGSLPADSVTATVLKRDTGSLGKMTGGMWEDGSQNFYMGDHTLFLRNDVNNGVGYYGDGKPFAGVSPDGPVLFGLMAGGLGTTGPDTLALTWNYQNRVALDPTDQNTGSLVPGLTFGNGSGEGIASKRTGGGNRWGLDFYTASTARMSINNSGYVGIGTTTPICSLDVAGNIHAQRLFVDQTIYEYLYGAYYNLGPTSSANGNTALWFRTTDTPSDERLKQEIQTVPHAVATIQQLRGVNFHWNQTGLKHLTRDIEARWKSASGKPEDDEQLWQQKRAERYQELARTQTGFIAQEVEQVFPDWVTTDPDTGFKQINMEHLDPILVNAIKEQQAEIESLKAQNAALETGMAELRTLVNQLLAK